LGALRVGIQRVEFQKVETPKAAFPRAGILRAGVQRVWILTVAGYGLPLEGVAAGYWCLPLYWWFPL
jgi:hypothetical protein